MILHATEGLDDFFDASMVAPGTAQAQTVPSVQMDESTNPTVVPERSKKEKKRRSLHKDRRQNRLELGFNDRQSLSPLRISVRSRGSSEDPIERGALISPRSLRVLRIISPFHLHHSP
jgi:hypothetical protein